MKIMYHPRLPMAERQVFGLLQDAHDQRLLPPELQRVPLPSIELGKPHRVREISLRDLAAGGGLEDAHVTGLRYLLRGGDTTAAAIDVALDADGTDTDDAGGTRIQALVSGEHIRRVDQTLRRIESGSAPKGMKTALVSMLRCRGLNLDVLVLEPQGGGAAQFHPIHHGLTPLQERQYGERDFLDIVQPEARRVLDEYTRDGGEHPVG